MKTLLCALVAVVAANSDASLSAIQSVVGGFQHICALDGKSQAWCWGSNMFGKLGVGHTSDSYVPLQLKMPEVPLRLYANYHNTCAMSVTGQLYCWGANDQSQLSDAAGSGAEIKSPTAVLAPSAVQDVAIGFGAICLLTQDQKVFCRGDNGEGQLGQGNSNELNGWNAVQLPVKVQTLYAGMQYFCGHGTDSSVWCWGRNLETQIGQGSETSFLAPSKVQVPGTVMSIRVGTSTACALNSNHDVWCWGERYFGGGAGDAHDFYYFSPTRMELPFPVSAIEGTGGYFCGRLINGEDYCWGYNYNGVFGQGGDVSAFETPRRVTFEIELGKLTSLAFNMCGVTDTGLLRCWGSNSYGEAGNGGTENLGDDERAVDLPFIEF